MVLFSIKKIYETLETYDILKTLSMNFVKTIPLPDVFSTFFSGPVNTRKGNSMKMHQMFSVRTTLAKFKKKRNIYRSFRNFCLRKTRLEKWHNYLDAILFERLCFQSISVFRTCTQTDAKPAFCKSSGLKRIFRKLSFHDGRPNRKNKPAFFKFLSEVQTELRFLQMW